MLFQDTPFFPFSWLGSLFVVAPLNGITHGGHGSRSAARLKQEILDVRKCTTATEGTNIGNSGLGACAPNRRLRAVSWEYEVP